MIQILETTPRKISGLTSLLVKFNYSDKIVAALKTLPTYYYHKSDYVWEFPISSLATLLDTLTVYDDIQLKLADAKTSPNSSFYSESDKIPRPLPKNANLVPKNESGDSNTNEAAPKITEFTIDLTENAIIKPSTDLPIWFKNFLIQK